MKNSQDRALGVLADEETSKRMRETSERAIKILDLIKTGMTSPTRIASRTGSTKQIVGYYLKVAGVPTIKEERENVLR